MPLLTLLLLHAFPPPCPSLTATSVMARGFTSQTRSLLSTALQSTTSAELSGSVGAMRTVPDGSYGLPEDDSGSGFEAKLGARRRSVGNRCS